MTAQIVGMIANNQLAKRDGEVQRDGSKEANYQFHRNNPQRKRPQCPSDQRKKKNWGLARRSITCWEKGVDENR